MKNHIIFTLSFLLSLNALANEPAWIKSKPTNPLYYTGIGMARISEDNDYIQRSKELALNDLISEIQIDIESNSLFNRQEINREYFEEFKNEIKTSTSATLEGYELVETWNDGTYYWSYYQLDKEEYNELVASRISDATQHAYDFWQKGNQLKQQGDIIGASHLFLNALKQIENYSNRYLPYTDDMGQTINLAVEIFNSIENIFKDINISADPETISFTSLSYNAYNVDIYVTSNNTPLKDIPLSLHFSKGNGDIPSKVKTNDSGIANVIISNVSSKLAFQEITISLNLDKLGYDNNSFIMEKLISKAPVLKIPMVVEDTSLSAVVYSYDDNCANIVNSLSNYLAQNYFDIVTDEDSADVRIIIDASIKEGGTVKGELYDMIEVYSSCTVTLTELNSERIISSVSINDIRSLAPVNYSDSRVNATAQRDLFKRLKPQLEAKLKDARFSKRIISNSQNTDEYIETEFEDTPSTPDL